MTLGWFVRGLHSFGSSALIVVAGLHLLQVLLFGAYRRPRELNWMVGLALFGVVAVFALSGYLLPWDQKGYWAKLVEATITGSAPVVGGAAQRLIQGGAAFGNHDADARLRAARDGAAGAADGAAGAPRLPVPAPRLHAEVVAVDRGRRPRAPSRPGPTRRFATPSWGCWRAASSSVAVIARHGAPLESPADPTSSYLARPEWYALPLFQLRMFFEGPLEIVATMVIPGIVTALRVRAAVPRPRRDEPPARSAARAGGRRAGPGGADGAGRDRAGQGRARSGLRQGARRGEGAHRDGAPPRARRASPPTATCLRNDPLYHAREIWDERCAGCHGLAGAGGEKGPDLKDYNSRAWIRGFLANPEGAALHGPGEDREGNAAGRGDAGGDGRAGRIRLRGDRRAPTPTRRRRAAGATCCRPRTATPATTSTAKARTTART